MLALLLWLMSPGSGLASPQAPPGGTVPPQTAPPTAAEPVAAVEPPPTADVWVFFSSSYLSPGYVYQGGYRLREGYENFVSSFDITIPEDGRTPPAAFLPLYRTPNLALQHAPGSRWLYQVHASENMIDFGEEIWALGGVNVSQILGYYRLWGGAEYELPFDDLSDWMLHNNPEFDYTWWWTRRLSPYESWFWDSHNPRFSAEIFMNMLPEAAQAAIGWRGRFPLNFEARRPPFSSSSNSSSSGSDDYIDVEGIDGDDELEDDGSPKKRPMAWYAGDGQKAGPSRMVKERLDINRTEAWVKSLQDVDPRLLPTPVLSTPLSTPKPAKPRSKSNASSSSYSNLPYNVDNPVDRSEIQRNIEQGRLDPNSCMSILTTLLMLLLRRRGSRDHVRQKRENSCRELWERLDLLKKDPDLLMQKTSSSSSSSSSWPIPDIFNLSSVYDAEFALIRSDFSATTAQELGYLPAPAFDGIRQKKADWSIFNHYHGRTQKNESSAYLVATRNVDKGLNRNRQPDKATFVYVVQISNNFIPVGETLGIRQPEEYAVARQVSMRMMHGWLNMASGKYERNKAFVSFGFAGVCAPAQPQLAGFPVGDGSWLNPAYHRHGRGCLFVEQDSPEPSPKRLAEAMKSCTRENRLEILKRHGENFLRRLPCVAVEQLAVYMEIGDDGTTESVWAGFPFQNVLMFEAASAGASRWVGVDLEMSHRKGAVLLADMGDLEVLCSSKNWRDSWTLKSLKLRGKCTAPRPAVEYDHYDGMNEEFQNTDGVKRVVWKHRLLPSRWKDCEDCQVLYPTFHD
ncbi:putative heat-labile enterotoxin [Ophiocordyceps polyrhachis-furcata BCC 54312]|uniref:Heat-labile enterotoxin n=1 Tax=Ophiocordyceps polyrhachis-furcata BCC 54312 TaxID=1330021 RepID=A0A367LBP2_9HYPO|nr:putative heat-labile enterotoxin [Ophiocordyceps polyrhachis-furcata BCC 54312]